MNGREIFNDYVKKAITNTSATKIEFSQAEGLVNIDVDLPEIGLKESAVSNLSNLKRVIVTIRSVPTSTMPLHEGDLTTIPKREEILIAFFDKRKNGENTP